MKIFYIIGLAFSMVTIASCNTEATLDCSSLEAFRASDKAMQATLSPEAQEEYAEAFMKIMVRQMSDEEFRVMMSSAFSKDETEQFKKMRVKALVTARRLFQGKTVQQILIAANKLPK